MVQVDLLLDKIVEHLKPFYPNVSVEKHKNLILIYVESEGIFLIILEQSFPYSPPIILYSGNLEYEYQPHLSRFGKNWVNICCYDTNEVHINPDEPECMIKTYLDRAEDIVKKKKTNYQMAKQDFEEEMASYINKISIKKRVISFLSPQSDSKVCGLHFREDNSLVFLEKGERNQFCSKEDYVLSVPIISLEYTDIPKSSRTLQAIYNKLLNQGYSHKFLVKFFIQSLNAGHLLILPFRVGGTLNSNFVLICRIPKKVRVKNNDLEELLTKQGGRSFKLVKCTCLAQDYIFSRGGLGSEFQRNQRVLIIGCGSFGSVVARMFVESGITNLKFIDHDILEAGNIARHICGVKDIGRPKALALRDELLKHNPNLAVECITKTVQSLSIDQLKRYLNNIDLIVSCTGDYASELFIVDVFQDMEKQIPLILLWGEPYLIAAHGIIIQKRQKDLKSFLYQCIGLNQNSIVKNSKDLTKIEFGCGSSYVPYSGFSVNHSIYSIMGQILNSILKKEGNFYLTWYNSISYYQQFSDLGILLDCELGKFPELKEIRLD